MGGGAGHRGAAQPAAGTAAAAASAENRPASGQASSSHAGSEGAAQGSRHTGRAALGHDAAGRCRRSHQIWQPQAGPQRGCGGSWGASWQAAGCGQAAGHPHRGDGGGRGGRLGCDWDRRQAGTPGVCRPGRLRSCCSKAESEGLITSVHSITMLDSPCAAGRRPLNLLHSVSHLLPAEAQYAPCCDGNDGHVTTLPLFYC